MIASPYKSSKFSYFLRLAQEVGYWNFSYRYLLRSFYKIARLTQPMRLSSKASLLLPHSSKFGTEVFLKREKLDWGSEAILAQFLDSEKSFIDVGANIGYYSLLAAPVSKNVYSFEPDLRMVEPLQHNISQFQNCHLIKEALYSEPGTMELSLEDSPELNSLVRHSSQANTTKVRVNTLDNFMLEQPSLCVSCIKTDAEGADFDILLGGKNLLVRDQPLVLSEAHPDEKLLSFIETIGFTCFGFTKAKAENGPVQEPKFIKISTPPQNCYLKMVFLVPNRLLSEFEDIAASS